MKDNAVLISKLGEIRGSAIAVLGKLCSKDVGESQRAMQEYAALVEQFNETCDVLAPPHYERSKWDVEFFVFQIDLAIRYYETER